MKRLWNAFFYSIHGMVSAWKDEAAFRQEVILAAFLLPLAVCISPDKSSLLWMVGSVFLVLLVELLNTAIEAAIDYTGTEIHPLAKKAKDTASAAVLVALVNMLVIWVIILLF